MKKLFVVVSVLLLIFATVMQAERQRIFMWHQAHDVDSLRSRAYFVGAYPNTLGIADGFESFSGNINIVGVLFHPDHLDQPPAYTIAVGPRLTGNESPEQVRSNRRFAQLEASATNHARELISSFDEQGLPTISAIYDGSDNLRRLRLGFSELNPSDEGFHFTWVAEAFPLPAALHQMIPVYLAATLLLAALFIRRKKCEVPA